MRCYLCQRESKKSLKRSYSQKKILRRQYINLQKKIIKGRRVFVCTRCLKTLYK